MAGKIPKESIGRVKVLLKSMYPIAVSLTYIREIVRIRNSSAETICRELGAKRVETTNGVYYKWVEK